MLLSFSAHRLLVSMVERVLTKFRRTYAHVQAHLPVIIARVILTNVSRTRVTTERHATTLWVMSTVFALLALRG